MTQTANYALFLSQVFSQLSFFPSLSSFSTFSIWCVGIFIIHRSLSESIDAFLLFLLLILASLDLYCNSSHNGHIQVTESKAFSLSRKNQLWSLLESLWRLMGKETLMVLSLLFWKFMYKQVSILNSHSVNVCTNI